MTDVPLRIRIRAEGSGDIKRELAQTTRAVAKAEEDAVKAAQKAEAAKRRERQRTDRAHERQIEDQARDEQDAIRDTLSEFERAERRKRQALARTQRDARTSSSRGGSAGGSGGVPRGNGMPGGGGGGSSSGTLEHMLSSVGGIAGVVAAVASAVNVFNSRVNRSAGIVGIQGEEEVLQAFASIDTELGIIAGDAGLTRQERDALTARVFEAAAANATTPEEIVAGLGLAQGNFDQLNAFLAQMDPILRHSVATGTSFGADINVLGISQRQLGLSQDDFDEALAIQSAQASRGSIEGRDVAQDFGAALSVFGTNTGRRGLDAFREANALFQTMGSQLTGLSSSEISTISERFLAGATDSDRVARLQEYGVNLVDQETGKIRDIGDIGRELAASEALNNPALFADAIGGDVNQQRGFMALRNSFLNDPEFFSSIRNVDAQEGQASLDRRYADAESRSSFQARKLALEGVSRIAGIGDERLGEHVERVRDFAEFTSANPRLAEWLPDDAIPLVAEEWQTQQRNMNGPEGSGVQFGSLSRGLLGIFGGSLGLALGGGIPGLPVGTPAAMPGAVKGVNAESERLTQATESTASALARLDVSVQANTRAQRAAAAAASASADTGGAPPAGVE